MTASVSRRIDFIDLAKGICIILVVCFHAGGFGVASVDDMFGSFRMPLYYLLSGLFFKPYTGFREFFIRKTNKLLIPFVFFYLTTSVILPYVFWRLFDYQINTVVGIESLWAFITPEAFPNVPIWFLWGLFLLNLLFYGCYLLAAKTRRPLWTLFALCMSIGIVQFIYRHYLRLPSYAFISNVFEAMPFFFFGYFLRNYSSILYEKPGQSNWYFSMLSVVLLALYTYVMASFRESGHYLLSSLAKYTCGIAGALMVMLLAKVLKRVSFVSYLGRYSIMILCTHNFLIQFSQKLCGKFIPDFSGELWVVLPLVLISYLLIIPFMKRFMPHVTAQRDVIPV